MPLAGYDIYPVSSGNIGIGASTPTTKLDVNGTISAGNIQIKNTATIDTTCSNVGLLARDNDGVPLVCQASGSTMNWKKIAGADIGNVTLSSAYEPSWSALIGAA